ncbi:MAG: hypothetical protein ACP5OR_00035 [Candidatus Dormibacteria bacterium]
MFLENWRAAQKSEPVSASFNNVTRDPVRSMLETARDNFLGMDSPGASDTMSGYKVHVYCDTLEDVMDAWKRLSPIVRERKLYAKLATNHHLTTASERQRHKGVTVYFPHRETAQQDARAIVQAMEGYHHDAAISGDSYMKNGVSWRFELSSDPGKDVTLKEYGDLYNSAGKEAPIVPSLNPYENWGIRLRTAEGSSASKAVLRDLLAHRGEIEQIVQRDTNAPSFRFTALNGVEHLLSNPATALTTLDDIVVDALKELGFEAEPRMYAQSGLAAGVKITAGSGYAGIDHAVLGTIGRHAREHSVRAEYLSPRTTIDHDLQDGRMMIAAGGASRIQQRAAVQSRSGGGLG